MNKILLDHKYLADAMHAAATEVFATMLGSEVAIETPSHSATVQSAEYGILSMLGLTGEWTGTGGLCCSADSARCMAAQMLFSEYPEVNDEVLDAIGEITNMVIGSFKNNISEQTGALAMSTPNVVFGREMTTSNGGANEWIVFPFSNKDYSFRMIVRLQRVADVSPRVHDHQHAMSLNGS